MPSSLNGTGVTFNDGSTLQSGNIPAANLGSGTANSTTFLRGDRTFAAPPSQAPTTAQVLTAYAGAAFGALGTYHVGYQSNITNMFNSNTYFDSNVNVAGSVLRNVSNAAVGVNAFNTVMFINDLVSPNFSGTYRRLSAARAQSANNANFTTSFLFLRIA